MAQPDSSRREMLRVSSATFAAALARMTWPDPVLAGQAENEELVPFIDEPRTPENRLDWETLDSWITPQDQVFSVQHYGTPEFDAKQHTLEVAGLVDRPRTFTMDELEALPKRDQLMTLECSGNGSNPGFMNAVYNSRWTGTPLAPLLKSCGIKPGAVEVVFFGVDRKEETVRKVTVEIPFGRSLSLDDALNLPTLLTYARNGQPLEKRNGAPLRLIVPGWYGIANVKWLTRIELRDRRYVSKFMGRDYVTLRGERRGGEVVFVQTSVSRMNLKSAIARVTRRPTRSGRVPLKAYGAVWGDGTEIAKVEVNVDDGAWRTARIDEEPKAKYCWRFFSIDLGTMTPGKHTLVSRAIDVNGRVQPSAEDDEIALKKTYWEAYQQWPRTIKVEA